MHRPRQRNVIPWGIPIASAAVLLEAATQTWWWPAPGWVFLPVFLATDVVACGLCWLQTISVLRRQRSPRAPRLRSRSSPRYGPYRRARLALARRAYMWRHHRNILGSAVAQEQVFWSDMACVLAGTAEPAMRTDPFILRFTGSPVSPRTST